MSMNENCPCKNCNARYEACHSTCEEYIEWNEDRLQKKSKMTKQKQIDDILSGMHSKSISAGAGRRLRNKHSRKNVIK